MREAASLRVFRISQQGRGGCVRLHQVLRLPGFQGCDVQLLEQLALPQATVKRPRRPLGFHAHTGQQGQQVRRQFTAENHFAGSDTRDPCRQLIGGTFGQAQLTFGHTQPSQSASSGFSCAFTGVHRQYISLGFIVQQLGIGQCAGCDHAHHFALDRSFATDFTDLFANSDGLAEFDQAR